MAVLLFSVGTVALVAGLVMVGFGIPINEFSFGNTLISAGTTAAVGGLIIIALGVTVGQLRRIAESLANPGSARFDQPLDISEPAGMAPQGPSPTRPIFPPRPRSEKTLAGMGPPPAGPASAATEDGHDQFAPPRLRNPEEAPIAVDDEISLSPSQPTGPASGGLDSFADRLRSAGAPAAGGGEKNAPEKGQEPPASWRPTSLPSQAPASVPRPVQPARFDAMWPAEPKTTTTRNSSPEEAKPPVTPARDQSSPVQKRAEPEAQRPRAAAILKSGVVDGMGYTLYVDGSIEAELPQGTLRFASINELRSHLEKNS
ncbi:MAG TPA: hypothetical protein VFB29_13080 [Pseudolabrys sp.]|nr:hypothetical protein [Pseudolabrys sp.]